LGGLVDELVGDVRVGELADVLADEERTHDELDGLLVYLESCSP
jgi:hypothetical protein